jgi:hypothetical protein
MKKSRIVLENNINQNPHPVLRGAGSNSDTSEQNIKHF